MSKEGSPKKPSKNKLFSLKDVVNYPNKISSTIGVILDCTGTYKTDESFDYVTKLRIIDNFYNPKNKLTLNTESTIYIFIYSKTETEAPRFRNIGDVILLKNFIFDTHYTKEGSIVRGNYNKSCSEWQIFSGRTNSPIQSIEKSRTLPSKVFSEEIEQIRKLREWLNTFFINNSLCDLSWYHSEFPNQIISENVYQLKDVDLLVKIIAEVKAVVNGLTYHRFVFVDEKKHFYFAELQKTGVDFELQSVVKLRSIHVFLHKNSRKIEFFNYSSIIVIPAHFKDAKEITKKTVDAKFSNSDLENRFFEELHLEKYTKNDISSNIFVFTLNNEKKGKNIKASLSDNFPELEQYDLSYVDLPNRKKSTKLGSHIGSVFLIEHQNLEITPLKELDKILQNCAQNSFEWANYQDQKFRIRVQIKSMNSNNFQEIAKLYSASQNKIWEAKEKDVAMLLSKDVKIIIYTTFQVGEKSNPSAVAIPIYLVTYDSNPEKIFDLWKILPDMSNVEDWMNMSAKTEKKASELLKGLINSEVEYDLIVELVKNAEGKNYFRIIDSCFWFPKL